jgi:hypothetical protein
VASLAGGLIAWAAGRFRRRRREAGEAPSGPMETSSRASAAGLRTGRDSGAESAVVAENQRPEPVPGRSPFGGAGGRGILFAAGLITGEAMLGILLAIPIVLASGQNPLDVGLEDGPPAWPGVVLLLAVMAALFAVARQRVGKRPPADSPRE